MRVEAEAGAEASAVGDPHLWRSAIGWGLLAVVGGMLASTVVALAIGHNHWWIPGDAWQSLRAAHYVPQGAYPLIYETGSLRDVFDAGPLLPLFLAPVAAIGDLFHLQESYPYTMQYPSMWLVYGPYALATAIPLVYAARALANQLQIRARSAVQAGVLLFAFVPMAVVYGHYEDVLALALLLLALRELLAGRELRGAFFLAGAIAFKQWSLLAVPVYLAASAPQLRFRVAARSVVPPALFFSFFVATDYRYASQALLHPPIFPQYGHAALWVSTASEYLSSAPTRAGALAVALGVAWVVRDERDPANIVSALGCVLLARFFFEPVAHAYYLAPGIVLLLLAERCRGNSMVTRVTVAAAMLLAFPFHPPRLLWWITVYALSAVLLYGPVVLLVRRSREVALRRVPTDSRHLGVSSSR